MYTGHDVDLRVSRDSCKRILGVLQPPVTAQESGVLLFMAVGQDDFLNFFLQLHGSQNLSLANWMVSGWSIELCCGCDRGGLRPASSQC